MTGYINKFNLFTLKWNNLCTIKLEGGLQVVNIHMKNKAFFLRLAWDLSYTYTPLTCLVGARF